MSLSTVEVRVPDAQQTSNDWDVLLERSLTEVLVHCICTGQKLMEVLEANVNSNTEANSTPDTVSTSDPALESEHVLGIDPKLGNLLLVGGESNKVLGNGLLTTTVLQEPSLGRIGVRDGLGGGEGLGCDKEEGSLWVGMLDGLGDVSTINVRDKVQSHLVVTIWLEGLGDHNWTAVGSVS